MMFREWKYEVMNMRKWLYGAVLVGWLFAAGCGKNPAGIPAAQASDREIYLFTQGWKGYECAVREVIIPAPDDPVFVEYAALQEAQGLPLAAHTGEQGFCYTYELQQSGGLYAQLLTAGGELIGAACYDPESGALYGIGGT